MVSQGGTCQKPLCRSGGRYYITHTLKLRRYAQGLRPGPRLHRTYFVYVVHNFVNVVNNCQQYMTNHDSCKPVVACSHITLFVYLSTLFYLQQLNLLDPS